ncbi:hypothetical protein E1263_08660 [Kribbella antibiotica]|uniref:Uncharacterized protein n=1 Tax=Kribbella antibiotica TaxID=190195 RepID=A0A4R4ZVA6_9ACTN|nr:hypothetical protein [Kribbella antibiotica]TDD61052.1 hypothetical protein E1263_08660 [Kribbella antibiotica]
MKTLATTVGMFDLTPFRRGELFRRSDVSGVSGTGVVAQVVLFGNGLVAVGWLGDKPCVQVWPCLDWGLGIHGHEGATEIRWLASDWADSSPTCRDASMSITRTRSPMPSTNPPNSRQLQQPA